MMQTPGGVPARRWSSSVRTAAGRERGRADVALVEQPATPGILQQGPGTARSIRSRHLLEQRAQQLLLSASDVDERLPKPWQVPPQPPPIRVRVGLASAVVAEAARGGVSSLRACSRARRHCSHCASSRDATGGCRDRPRDMAALGTLDPRQSARSTAQSPLGRAVVIRLAATPRTIDAARPGGCQALRKALATAPVRSCTSTDVQAVHRR